MMINEEYKELKARTEKEKRAHSEKKWTDWFQNHASIPHAEAREYGKVFVKHRIQRSSLPKLNKDLLRDMGIVRVGDALQILEAVKQASHAEAAEYKRDMLRNTAPAINRLAMAAADAAGSTMLVDRDHYMRRAGGNIMISIPKTRAMPSGLYTLPISKTGGMHCDRVENQTMEREARLASRGRMYSSNAPIQKLAPLPHQLPSMNYTRPTVVGGTSHERQLSPPIQQSYRERYRSPENMPRINNNSRQEESNNVFSRLGSSSGAERSSSRLRKSSDRRRNVPKASPVKKLHVSQRLGFQRAGAQKARNGSSQKTASGALKLRHRLGIKGRLG